MDKHLNGRLKGKLKKNLNRKRKGFSLVELVVVMAIIGILIMVMAPNYKGFIDQAKTVGVRSDAKTLQTMISLVEVKAELPENTKVSDLVGESMGDESSEWANLKSFINELSGESVKLKDIAVEDLDTYVKTGGPTSPDTP